MLFSTTVRIERGKMTVRNRPAMVDVVSRARDGEYVLTIERLHATRSKAQNDYYFAVMVARVADFWSTPAKRWSEDAAHEVLKATFLPHDLALNGLNGTLLNGYVIGGSTAKLNKLQFVEYLEAIQMHFAERGLVIPDPDPLWRQHAEDELRKEVQEAIDVVA